MLVYISNNSVLEFWRKTSARDALAGTRLRPCRLPNTPIDAREFCFENPLRLASPLHVLVGSGNARKEAKGLTCHVDSRRFPENSFIRLSTGLIVSSPELCFAQMAGELSLIELIMLGFEFCGSYRLDVVGEPERGFRDDLPLTSTSSLSSFMAELKNLKGYRNACRALRYTIDGSAPPMETALAMMLTLPYGLGGYGFSKPLMNAPIEIKNGRKGNARKSRFYCDLYWPDEQVDVEYDSDAYHAYADQIHKDAVKRNALSSAGVTVVTVSRRQIASTAELRKTAEVLSKLFEKRLRYPVPEFHQRHAELRSRLLPKAPRYSMKV